MNAQAQVPTMDSGGPTARYGQLGFHRCQKRGAVRRNLTNQGCLAFKFCLAAVRRSGTPKKKNLGRVCVMNLALPSHGWNVKLLLSLASNTAMVLLERFRGAGVGSAVVTPSLKPQSKKEKNGSVGLRNWSRPTGQSASGLDPRRGTAGNPCPQPLDPPMAGPDHVQDGEGAGAGWEGGGAWDPNPDPSPLWVWG